MCRMSKLKKSSDVEVDGLHFANAGEVVNVSVSRMRFRLHMRKYYDILADVEIVKVLH